MDHGAHRHRSVLQLTEQVGDVFCWQALGAGPRGRRDRRSRPGPRIQRTAIKTSPKNAISRQLFPAQCHLPRVVWCVLRGVQANRMLDGARNPMPCPTHAFRVGSGQVARPGRQRKVGGWAASDTSQQPARGLGCVFGYRTSPHSNMHPSGALCYGSAVSRSHTSALIFIRRPHVDRPGVHRGEGGDGCGWTARCHDGR